MHFPSDVLCGALVGIFSGVVAYLLVMKLAMHKLGYHKQHYYSSAYTSKGYLYTDIYVLHLAIAITLVFLMFVA